MNKKIYIKVKSSLKEIKEAQNELHLQCNLKLDEINNRIDEIKTTVNERTAHLISKIKAQQGFLIGEANKIQQNITEKIQSILDADFFDPNINCEIMEKKELEDLQTILDETKEVVSSNLTELNQIDCMVEFKLDEQNEYEIGRIDNTNMNDTNQTKSYYEQALQLMKSNRYFEAIKHFNKVTEDGLWFSMEDGLEDAYFNKGNLT
jgi:TolA-binding protein